jgi:hypothetical protein
VVRFELEATDILRRRAGRLWSVGATIFRRAAPEKN